MLQASHMVRKVMRLSCCMRILLCSKYVKHQHNHHIYQSYNRKICTRTNADILTNITMHRLIYLHLCTVIYWTHACYILDCLVSSTQHTHSLTHTHTHTHTHTTHTYTYEHIQPKQIHTYTHTHTHTHTCFKIYSSHTYTHTHTHTHTCTHKCTHTHTHTLVPTHAKHGAPGHQTNWDTKALAIYQTNDHSPI